VAPNPPTPLPTTLKPHITLGHHVSEALTRSARGTAMPGWYQLPQVATNRRFCQGWCKGRGGGGVSQHKSSCTSLRPSDARHRQCPKHNKHRRNRSMESVRRGDLADRIAAASCGPSPPALFKGFNKVTSTGKGSIFCCAPSTLLPDYCPSPIPPISLLSDALCCPSATVPDATTGLVAQQQWPLDQHRVQIQWLAFGCLWQQQAVGHMHY
jgi:hypothetical protein